MVMLRIDQTTGADHVFAALAAPRFHLAFQVIHGDLNRLAMGVENPFLFLGVREHVSDADRFGGGMRNVEAHPMTALDDDNGIAVFVQLDLAGLAVALHPLFRLGSSVLTQRFSGDRMVSTSQLEHELAIDVLSHQAKLAGQGATPTHGLLGVAFFVQVILGRHQVFHDGFADLVLASGVKSGDADHGVSCSCFDDLQAKQTLKLGNVDGMGLGLRPLLKKQMLGRLRLSRLRPVGG